jgi:formylglycine-generating enzyme
MRMLKGVLAGLMGVTIAWSSVGSPLEERLGHRTSHNHPDPDSVARGSRAGAAIQPEHPRLVAVAHANLVAVPAAAPSVLSGTASSEPPSRVTPEVDSAVAGVAAPVAACPADMVLVEGDYCTDVAHTCTRWLDNPDLPFTRCAEYTQPARCVGQRVKLRFCVDRYEYTPPGEALPQNFSSFERASRTCEALGKRICTESEWNFACEGEEMRPYPYGWTREPVCNNDRDDLYVPNPHMQVLADRREPAGTRPDCKSPFGVFDMTGNLDEPVLHEVNRNAPPHRSALKGGWWLPARNRCRAATTAHDDYYTGIQVGVRCCGGASAPEHAAG